MEHHTLPYQSDASQYFLKLHHLPGCAWLDSASQDAHDGRWDILTALPSQQWINPAPEIFQDTLEPLLARHRQSFDHDQELDPAAPFCGGLLGFMGYEFANRSFGLPSKSQNQCTLGWYDWSLVLDHKRGCAGLYILASCDNVTKQAVLAALAAAPSQSGAFTCQAFRNDEPKSHYLKSLKTIQNYILSGDCYQTNYTQRFSAQCTGSPVSAYLTLRNATPNPFCAYLALPGNNAIMSLSQERFIRIQGRQATTQPIKGTAPRSADPELDQAIKTELRKSTKNRAENLMIVDLLRNDFSKNCLPHSVVTEHLFEAKTYRNVHHLVSTIKGTLKPEVSHSQFLMDCFPGGSITGAPKKRAMEIIDELETHPREVYCGAIGYFSVSGHTDFNISIRTLLWQDNQVYCWAGGGIVADSEPEQEYDECLQKISILLERLSGRPLKFS